MHEYNLFYFVSANEYSLTKAQCEFSNFVLWNNIIILTILK